MLLVIFFLIKMLLKMSNNFLLIKRQHFKIISNIYFNKSSINVTNLNIL